MMDIHEILKKLPHRYPFLLVDRVIELEKGKHIRCLKNVTINEPLFGGHFPLTSHAWCVDVGGFSPSCCFIGI